MKLLYGIVMDGKDIKHDAAVDTLQAIFKRLREKGPDFLEKEEMAVCLTTIGFEDVCKKVGVPWNEGIVRDFKERLNKLDFDLGWMDRKTPPELAPFLVHCARGDISKVHCW